MNPRLIGLRLLFLALGVIPAIAGGGENILVNGNFNVGKIHWLGDGVVTPAGGSVFLRLDRERWTVLSQQITTGASNLELKVLYSLSPFCSLAKDPVATPLTSGQLKTATGLASSIPDLPLGGDGAWFAFLLKDGHIIRQVAVPVNRDEDNPHTLSTTIFSGAQPVTGEYLCIAFPPGKGMVTISNMQLLRQR